MNVEIGAEAAQFPEKEYKNGSAFAVWGFLQVWLMGMIWMYVPVESKCGVTGNIDLLHQAHFRLENYKIYK
jgi:hypothetical protein